MSTRYQETSATVLSTLRLMDLHSSWAVTVPDWVGDQAALPVCLYLWEPECACIVRLHWHGYQPKVEYYQGRNPMDPHLPDAIADIWYTGTVIPVHFESACRSLPDVVLVRLPEQAIRNARWGREEQVYELAVDAMRRKIEETVGSNWLTLGELSS